MAEPRRTRTKHDKVALNKEEMQVMKHLRFSVKTEDGKLQSSTVPYFNGNVIVDCLMQSKYSTKVPPSGSTRPYFPDRKSAVAFLGRAVWFGVFMRVERKRRIVDRNAEPERGAKVVRKRVAASGSAEKADSNASASGKESEVEKDKKEKKESTKKPKRPVKLVHHTEQVFVDSNEAMFIWNYDPTRPRNVVLGLLLVFGAIAVCLYPIWPRDVQVYTSYVSRIALVVLGFLLVVLVLRYVVAAVVYVMTFGRVTFWILPNVDDDKLGFRDSFTPIYSVIYNDAAKKKKRDASAKEDKSKQKSDSGQPADAKKNEEAEKKRPSKKKAAASGKDSKPESDELVQSSPDPLAKPDKASVASSANVEPRTGTDVDEDQQFEMISKDDL